jgi:hypothetical protein
LLHVIHLKTCRVSCRKTGAQSFVRAPATRFKSDQSSG